MPLKNLDDRKVYARAYRGANRDRICAWDKEYREKNSKKIRQRKANWKKKNRERLNEKEKARSAFRSKTDPNFRIRNALRTRLRGALNGLSKSARTLELLGCTIEFLREHLEKQFVPGMTWENYGPVWHVDHILPCAEFHLQHSEEQEICFHWTNLQPLFAADNLIKGDKII